MINDRDQRTSVSPDLHPLKSLNRSRLVGLDLDNWFPVAWADALEVGKVITARLWNAEVSTSRTATGELQANVRRDEITPYACACAERYNIIWVFPGDPDLANTTALPDVPEYDNPKWLIVEIPGHYKCHFSIVNENPLDVFHGHLHEDLQGWYNPVLTSVDLTDHSVEAAYEVTFRNAWLLRFLGVVKSKEPELKRVIEVGYHYPHCRNTMPKVSNYYFMRQPVGPEETRSFGLMCLPIRLPTWLKVRLRKPLSRILWRFVVKPFLDQDIEVMESEQRTFRKNPGRNYIEINPVIAAAQRLTIRKFDAFEARRAQHSPGEANGSAHT